YSGPFDNPEPFRQAVHGICSLPLANAGAKGCNLTQLDRSALGWSQINPRHGLGECDLLACRLADARRFARRMFRRRTLHPKRPCGMAQNPNHTPPRKFVSVTL